MRISYLVESVGVRLIFLILIDVLAISFGIALINIDSQYAILKIALFLILGVLGYKTFKNSLSYLKGMNGENEVYKVLKQLPQEYKVLHDFVEGKRGNIDYIVVGPTGLWTVEVKNYKEQNIDNQFLEKNLKQAYAEAKALSDHLSLSVNPILVFTNPKTKLHFGLNKQKGVYVIGKKWLFDLVQNESYGSSLSPEQCSQISSEIKKFTSII